MDGVDIDWAHTGADGKYAREASIAAAKAMVYGFDIQSLGGAPALQSRYTLGYGIDTKIRWTGTLVVADADGNMIKIETTPRSGMNLQLRRVGESYGVIKYKQVGSDEPHWSDNGT